MQRDCSERGPVPALQEEEEVRREESAFELAMIVICPMCLERITEKAWREAHGRMLYCRHCRIAIDPVIISETSPKVEEEVLREMQETYKESIKYWKKRRGMI